MKTQELKSRIKILPVGYGIWEITDLKTGNTGISKDTLAMDRINMEKYGLPPRIMMYEYTYRQALQALFNTTIKY